MFPGCPDRGSQAGSADFCHGKESHRFLQSALQGERMPLGFHKGALEHTRDHLLRAHHGCNSAFYVVLFTPEAKSIELRCNLKKVFPADRTPACNCHIMPWCLFPPSRLPVVTPCRSLSLSSSPLPRPGWAPAHLSLTIRFLLFFLPYHKPTHPTR